MSTLQVLRPREASIFAAFVDAVVAPAPPLPPVHQTDAAFAFDAGLAAAPAANRLGIRVALLALELTPLLLGYGHRLRGLEAPEREAALARLDRGPLTALLKGLRALAHINYYGDADVMRIIGYDATVVVARGAALREQEHRW